FQSKFQSQKLKVKSQKLGPNDLDESENENTKHSTLNPKLLPGHPEPAEGLNPKILPGHPEPVEILNSKLSIWGISATIGNLEEAKDVLLAPLNILDIDPADATIIKADIQKNISVESIFPDEIEK